MMFFVVIIKKNSLNVWKKWDATILKSRILVYLGRGSFWTLTTSHQVIITPADDLVQFGKEWPKSINTQIVRSYNIWPSVNFLWRRPADLCCTQSQQNKKRGILTLKTPDDSILCSAWTPFKYTEKFRQCFCKLFNKPNPPKATIPT